MGSRLLWRRAATAAGIYSATAFGFLGTLLSARALGPGPFGLLAIVIAATLFFQSFMDLTVEEAVIKYGFRYSTAESWGKLRRLFGRALRFKLAGGVLAGIAIAVLAPVSHALFHPRHGDLSTPLLVAAVLPLVQAPEGLAGTAIILRGRYDIRSWFLAFSMALRCLALGLGSQYGVTEAVVGIVLAQIVATAAIAVGGLAAFRRFPSAPSERLGDDRRELLAFVGQSTVATTVISLRGTFGSLLLALVTNPFQVGYFRSAQAPQSALQSLSAPARLILLTEQTRDWEHGRHASVFSGVRRYSLGVAALGCVVLPPLLVFMPDLIRILLKPRYLPATDAARLLVGAAMLSIVIGWTKSLPVSIGRPGLRVLTHGIETAVFIPLIAAFGAAWGATGAGAAVLVSTCVFAAVWLVLIARLRRSLPRGAPVALAP